MLRFSFPDALLVGTLADGGPVLVLQLLGVGGGVQTSQAFTELVADDPCLVALAVLLLTPALRASADLGWHLVLHVVKYTPVRSQLSFNLRSLYQTLVLFHILAPLTNTVDPAELPIIKAPARPLQTVHLGALTSNLCIQLRYLTLLDPRALRLIGLFHLVDPQDLGGRDIGSHLAEIILLDSV